MTAVSVNVAAPLPLQVPVIDSPARFKVLNWGRRASKTRLDLHCSLFGHGPELAPRRPRWKGLVQGLDVAWVGPDFPQLQAIWEEEIRPRFGGVEGFVLHEGDHTLTITGLGTLWFVSFENVRKVRGRGKQLAGVVLDESAHYNLGYAWRSVIRPALMDCGGWAIFSSTPNSGPDGAMTDAGQRIVPSFFNRLCVQVKGGLRGPEWQYWHADARQNPVIDPQEFRELVAEYDAQSEVALREEVYAELLVGGAGLAFPKWDEAIHVRQAEPGPDAEAGAGMDWGHGTPGWFGMVYAEPDGRLLMREEWYFKRLKAKRVGYEIGKRCIAAVVDGRRRAPDVIALDSACFSVTGVGSTIAEKLTEGLELAYHRHNRDADREGPELVPPTFMPAPKGPEAIRTQKVLVHEVLDWERDEDGVLVDPPLLTVHPECKDFRRTVAALLEDPKNRNKFDCFVAGTLVETIDGPVPIESIPVGTLVKTPVGYRPVTHAYVSGRSPTVRVHLANGSVLEGTGHHRVFVEGLGLVALRNLTRGMTLTGKITRLFPCDDPVSALSIAAPSFSYAAAAAIGEPSTGSASDLAPFSCTERSGAIPTDLSRPDSWCTTAITTEAITALRTWSSWRDLRTPDSMSVSDWLAVISLERWIVGAEVPGARPRCEAMLARCVNALPDENLRALIVESLLRQDTPANVTARVNAPSTGAPSKTGESVKCAGSGSRGRRPRSDPRGLAVTAVAGCSEKRPVYNLTVRQAHLFYANGVLVTNTKGEDHAVQGFAYFLVLRAPDATDHTAQRELAAVRRELDEASRHESEEWEKIERA